MRLRIPETRRARRTAAALALAALLAAAAACDPDGASKKQAAERAASNAPAGSQAPRTNLPMPPVATAHSTSANAAAPRGAWTQLDGRRAALSDFRGQVVVLDFWATYCAPCREEVPHLVKLQKQFGPQGFKVIGLNVGGEDDQPKIPEFVKQYGIQYQLGFPDDQTVGLFLAGDDSIPHTFVIDRQGRLVTEFVGYGDEAAAELEQAVTSALSSKAD
jgi:thiol-disulfide isomerase/thioredoxin